MRRVFESEGKTRDLYVFGLYTPSTNCANVLIRTTSLCLSPPTAGTGLVQRGYSILYAVQGAPYSNRLSERRQHFVNFSLCRILFSFHQWKIGARFITVLFLKRKTRKGKRFIAASSYCYRYFIVSFRIEYILYVEEYFSYL